MARIAGVDIPNNKKVEFSVRYIYGIGPTNALEILEKANVELGTRVKDLTEEQLAKLQKAIETFTVEGDLRREVVQNIKRLEEAGAYRGLRHRHSLPVRGQRTRSNARTKRGKRQTVGSIKKEK
jgi:small subunit ribosomal protein S13